MKLYSVLLAFVILGPLGSFIGNGLSAVLVFIQSHVSVLAYMIMAAAMPFIVMTGMHWAFIPVVFAALETPAGESLMLPAMLISNLAQGAACLAVAVKSRNSNLKQLGGSSAVSAIFAGVTEPGLYGVTMPLKRPPGCCMHLQRHHRFDRRHYEGVRQLLCVSRSAGAADLRPCGEAQQLHHGSYLRSDFHCPDLCCDLVHGL